MNPTPKQNRRAQAEQASRGIPISTRRTFRTPTRNLCSVRRGSLRRAQLARTQFCSLERKSWPISKAPVISLRFRAESGNRLPPRRLAARSLSGRGLGPESGLLDGLIRQGKSNDANQPGEDEPKEARRMVNVNLAVGIEDHRGGATSGFNLLKWGALS